MPRIDHCFEKRITSNESLPPQEDDAFAMYKRRMSKAYTYRNAVLNSGPQNNFMSAKQTPTLLGPNVCGAPSHSATPLGRDPCSDALP